MGARNLACRSCLNPNHWPISRKVAAGPAILILLLGMVVFLGWSVAGDHQELMSRSYEEQSASEEIAFRLPHVLARVQRDLYKLTIWAQIDVEGPEVTSTLEGIDGDLADIGNMLSRLEGRPLFDQLDQAVGRYERAVRQALILIQRSPRVGATATRGIDRVYLEADATASRLAAVVKELFDQRIHESHASWQRLIIKFLVLIGAVVLLVPLITMGSDRMIAKPIMNLARVVDQFRQGQLDVDVPSTTREDEIGLVARAMEAFRANLIRNQILEREREQLNQQLERRVEERTQQLAAQTERLAQALEKEHELNGLQRQFVSMVCHEFRTPLAIIDGNAQRIMKRCEKMPPDRVRDILGRVRLSVSRLIDLMESVLSASKLEAGAIKMDPAACNLAEMITEVANNHRELNPAYKIETEIAGLPESFVVDIKLMRQVVSNLLSNAIKYSPEGAQVRIEATSCEDGAVKIAVRDQGVGIPADELENLFQRFFRASTSTGIAGTGIGLHMVKTLVDMHDGHIDVDSDVGVGTIFTVCLPPRDGLSVAEDVVHAA